MVAKSRKTKTAPQAVPPISGCDNEVNTTVSVARAKQESNPPQARIAPHPEERVEQQNEGRQLSLPTSSSRGLAAWLIRHNVGLVCSTYLTGHLFFVGASARGQLVLSAAYFARAMGVAAFSQRLYVATKSEVWRLENALGSDELANDLFDRLYTPRNAQVTGDLDIHELAVEPGGRILFANTKYSCLATLSTTRSFKPIWQPKFISRLAPEDRCHLNGLAMEDGKARYMTACGTKDVLEGWRENRQTGGVLIDVQTDDIVAEGLSMPHSPRVKGNYIYLLESGRGKLVRIDRHTGRKEDMTTCNGFARGLAFCGDYAIITLSLPRGLAFRELPISTEMEQQQEAPWRGLQIIDLRNGDIVEWLRFEGKVTELFDVAVIPGVRCPRGLGPDAPEVADLLRGEEIHRGKD